VLARILRWMLPLLILAAGVAAFDALRASRPTPAPLASEEKAWIVAVQAVAPATASPELTLYGRVDSPRIANLSAAVSADVREVHVLAGEEVGAGEVLVVLDDEDIALTVAQREAEVAEIRARIELENERHDNDRAALAHEQRLLDLARRAVLRAQNLVRSSAGSQAQLDDARREEERQALAVADRRLAIRQHASRIAELRATLARAEALLASARLDARRTRVRAPFVARVSRVSVTRGDRVRPGDALVTLYDGSALEVRAQIPTRHLAAIRTGLAGDPDASRALVARATVDGQPVRAVLDRLSSLVERGSGGVEGLFRVERGGQWLQLGRTVELALALPPEPDAVALPLEALYGTGRVFELEGERMRAVDVERLGEIRTPAGETRVLVRSPELAHGDQVVITQLPNAMDGLKVRVAEQRAQR